MQAEEQCNEAAEKYYQSVLRYCARMMPGDLDGAQECTQEVFLLMVKKRDTLNFDQNIRAWLMETAYRTVMHYCTNRANQQKLFMACSDIIELFPADTDAESQSSPLDSLTDEELQLAAAYYEAPRGTRIALAAQYGLTLHQLYSRINSIRQKLRDSANVPETDESGESFV